MTKKEELLKLSIILSVIVVVFSYFELFRYMSLHVSKPSVDYSSLTRALPSRVVVVCNVATRPFINSMLDQTVKVDEICLFSSEKSSYPEVNSYDYGSNPIVSSLKKERDSNTVMIYLDGNTVYSPEYIEDICAMYVSQPNKLIVDGENALYKSSYFNDNVITADRDVLNYRAVDVVKLNGQHRNYRGLRN